MSVAGASPVPAPDGKPQNGIKLPDDVLQVDWEKLLRRLYPRGAAAAQSNHLRQTDEAHIGQRHVQCVLDHGAHACRDPQYPDGVRR
jgi:hypothetical protein